MDTSNVSTPKQMTSEEVQERIEELSQLKVGWDGEKDTDRIHLYMIEALKDAFKKLPPPTDINPVASYFDLHGSYVEIEWRGPVHEFAIVYGPMSPDDKRVVILYWMIIINRHDMTPSRRYFESDNAGGISLRDAARFAQEAMH